MVVANLAYQGGHFPCTILRKRFVIKGSFISIYISIIDDKLLLKIDLFETGNLSELFATFSFYMI